MLVNKSERYDLKAPRRLESILLKYLTPRRLHPFKQTKGISFVTELMAAAVTKRLVHVQLYKYLMDHVSERAAARCSNMYIHPGVG